MKIANPTGDPDCRKPQYRVAFKERRVEDLKFDSPRKAFERVRQISKVNEAFYQTFLSPWVRASANPWTAAALKWLQPMRTSRYLFSERFAPWMHAVAAMAAHVRRNRENVPADDARRSAEKRFSGEVSRAITSVREIRDNLEEAAFRQLYG
jgi:hypothetical protein